MVVLYISTLLCLLSNDGLLLGDLCQHRGIHCLANDTKAAFPFIFSIGGRLPFSAAVFIASLSNAVKDSHQTKYNYPDHSCRKYSLT